MYRRIALLFIGAWLLGFGSIVPQPAFAQGSPDDAPVPYCNQFVWRNLAMRNFVEMSTADGPILVSEFDLLCNSRWTGRLWQPYLTSREQMRLNK